MYVAVVVVVVPRAPAARVRACVRVRVCVCVRVRVRGCVCGRNARSQSKQGEGSPKTILREWVTWRGCRGRLCASNVNPATPPGGSSGQSPRIARSGMKLSLLFSSVLAGGGLMG